MIHTELIKNRFNSLEEYEKFAAEWTEVRLEGVDMKEYEVIGHATVVCSMHVKANDKTEAIKKANEEFGALTNYAGMGGTAHMLGVCDSSDDRCVFPDSDPEFDECQEVE